MFALFPLPFSPHISFHRDSDDDYKDVYVTVGMEITARGQEQAVGKERIIKY